MRSTSWPAPTTKAPDLEEIRECMLDGGCPATDDCWVELDGTCPHGHPSWMIALGMI